MRVVYIMRVPGKNANENANENENENENEK